MGRLKEYHNFCFPLRNLPVPVKMTHFFQFVSFVDVLYMATKAKYTAQHDAMF